MMKKLCLVILCITWINSSLINTYAQDKGKFVKKENKFYKQVEEKLDEFYAAQKDEKKKEKFIMDMDNMSFPTDITKYKQFWHNDVESQARTNVCWSFSGVSYLESELYRTQKMKIKLSQIFIVYYEYLEKATGFVNTRGESYFAEGSEGNAVTKVIRKYGIVPYKLYTGLPEGQPYHDHEALYNELKDYLKGVKASNAWNLDIVLSTVKAILNHYIGEPPVNFTWEGKTYSPKTFVNDYLKLDVDDYVDIVSYMQQPYYEQVEYEVPDNWWHDKSYYNIPLDEYMTIIKKSVDNGYSVCIGGDVSEAGYNAIKEVGIVPTFDIPRKYIDENARQFRFSNKTTQDDHGIHIVGYQIVDNDYWFLIKDSGSGSRNGEHVGYRFVREDYVKLKWMDIMVHKDMAENILKKCNSKHE